MTDIVYLPYKSINVFITREYLEKVIRQVLMGYSELPKEKVISFVNQFREHVTILGFRNVVKAPLSLQINAYASAFEEKNEVVPFTLSSWAHLNTSLASEVEAWLQAEGWKDLSVYREFTDTEAL